MKFKEVDKALYRKRLNKVIAVFVVTFAILAVVFGSVLIALFGQPIVDPETQSNFKFNVAGVVLALLFMSMLMNQVKRHIFLQDIYYVWQLKQIHNRIYRKLVKIKKASEANDDNALIILAFYYRSLKQVYQLDDNTLTISKVNQDISDITHRLAEQNFDEVADKFDEKLLASY